MGAPLTFQKDSLYLRDCSRYSIEPSQVDYEDYCCQMEADASPAEELEQEEDFS